MLCLNCNAENIEGVDTCEQCGQSLSELSRPVRATAVERALLKDRIVDLPTTEPPISVAPSEKIGVVLDLLVDNRVGCAIVIENQEIVGIFSERDVLMRINDEIDQLRDHPISEFMTPNPRVLESTARIAYAVQRMDQGGYRHIPIVDGDGSLTGIISVRDILRYLADKLALVDAV